MDASARRLGALACLAAMAFARVIVAQPAPSPSGVELHYEAYEGCPAREAFAQNLDARRRGAARAQGAVQLDVRLKRAEQPDRIEGSLVLRSANGASSARRIVASSCSEAADALALIAALVLQGIELEEVADNANDDRSARRAEKPRAREPDRTTTTAAVEEPATSTATTASTEPEAQAETATEREVTEVTEVAEVREARDDESEPAEEDDAAEGPPHAYVLLSGGVASGVLPSLQPLPELALSLERGAPAVLMWSVHAAFRISPDQTRHFEGGIVAFGWWTGVAALCAGARGTEVSLSGCAALEVGRLSAEARDTERPRDAGRAWVALGPGLTLAYDLTQALRLTLRAELLTPLARYRLELPEGTAVHVPADLGVRAGLGVGLRLW